MQAPVSTTIPESHLDLLGKRGFAHLATVGGDGSPQSTPMWFDWDGEHLLFSTLRIRQKSRNLVRDGRVAVSITDPDNPYRYLQVRGVATIEDDDGRLIHALVAKYLGSGISPWDEPGAERVVLKVKPRHVCCIG